MSSEIESNWLVFFLSRHEKEQVKECQFEMANGRCSMSTIYRDIQKDDRVQWGKKTTRKRGRNVNIWREKK